MKFKKLVKAELSIEEAKKQVKEHLNAIFKILSNTIEFGSDIGWELMNAHVAYIKALNKLGEKK